MRTLFILLLASAIAVGQTKNDLFNAIKSKEDNTIEYVPKKYMVVISNDKKAFSVSPAIYKEKKKYYFYGVFLLIESQSKDSVITIKTESGSYMLKESVYSYELREEDSSNPYRLFVPENGLIMSQLMKYEVRSISFSGKEYFTYQGQETYLIRYMNVFKNLTEKYL